MLTHQDIKELHDNYDKVANALHELIKTTAFKNMSTTDIEHELIHRQYNRTRDKASILKTILQSK